VTSKKLTGIIVSDQMSFVADTHASHLAQQENDKEQTIHGTYGLGLGKPLASYDQNTRSWKTYGDISLWGDLPSLENLPQSGMTQNGALYQLQAWELNTVAKGSSLWPTPTSANWTTSTSMEQIRRHLAKYPPSSRLVEQVALADPDASGCLNPTWVEWLMGFPTGWTDLRDSETQ
jgi:hypothetical protein